MEVGTILALIAIGVSATGLLAQHFVSIAKLKERLVRIETKVDVFWKAVEGRLVDMLHSPHSPEVDVLLDKMKQGGLSLDEAIHLRNQLDMQYTNANPHRNIALILVLGRLEQVIVELKPKSVKK